ncbi:MAG TPA: efflux RND transporter permease subunit [Methylomirabilota bacterium]|nr:efflux RND transporter permease subunit [Methylomirabilota bacterium]
MLRAIVEFSVRFRGVIIALACLTLGYGLWTAWHARLDVFPEFAPPQVTVVSEAPGLSPEQVETLVTLPVERAVNGVGGLRALRSQSIQALSVITATFRHGTDIFRGRQLVGERLLEATGSLPAGIHAPVMAPLTSAASTVLVLGLVSETRSLMELRTIADWTVRPQLLGVPGVAKVVIFGGQTRQLQAQVRVGRLAAYGLAIDDVLAAARAATGVRGAGFVDTGPQRVVLRTEGQAFTPEQLGRVVITRRDGASIRLQDVARVVDGIEPRVGDAQIMGRPGVLLAVSSQFGANTMEVTRAVEQSLGALRPALEGRGVTLYPALFRPANFITTALGNVERSLGVGGALVIVVLAFFLLNVRTAVISFTSIPLSLLAAVIVLDRLGASLNTLTLGGLAIAIGMVVDDAIIDVENVWRRLRETRATGDRRPVARVITDAVLEVRSPVVYATFVVVLIFLPVLTLPGVAGRLFAPLGVASILALLASLAVAMTVTPALCSLLLAHHAPRPEPRYIGWLRSRHRAALATANRHRGLVVTIAAVLFGGAAAVLPFLGGEFLPEFHESHFILHMSAIPGTSLEQSLELGRRVTATLLADPAVRLVAQRVGRAEESDDWLGTHASEFEVDLKPLAGDEAEDVQARIRRALAGFPGVTFAITPFLSERIEETLSGATAEVVVKVFGDDLDAIDRGAREVARTLSGVPGAREVQIASPAGIPELVVRLRADRLTQFGFHPVSVLEAIQTAYQGAVATQVYEDDRILDVAVVLDAAARRDPEGVGELMLRSAEGVRLPVRVLADVELGTGRYVVFHDGTRRVQLVTCNVAGRDVASFAAQARRRVERDVRFEAGVSAVFTGAAEAQAEARRQLIIHTVVAAVACVLLLGIVIGSGRNLALVLANLPFALVGGVLAVFAMGGVLSLGSLVGFVTLFGITTRNSILLVSHYQHLVEVEGLPWNLETSIRGATERLLPILMTALVTALGLLPLALSPAAAGHEIDGPMAVVILGGLVTSTALNLLVLPTVALRYGRLAPSTGTAVG